MILSITRTDCIEPLRFWLFILIITLGFHIIMLFLGDMLRQKAGSGSDVAMGYLAINTILQCFLFLWMLVGLVWFLNDINGCRDEFYEGWMLTLAILSIYFGIIALILLGIVLIGCITCVGSWHISAFLKEKDNC